MRPQSVSIVIPHHGDSAPTQALLAALAVETNLLGMEVIVCDDASPTPFPTGADYRVVRRDTNGGFGSAVNDAAKLATGDLLLILNSDLALPPGIVADLLAHALSHQPCIASPAVVEHEELAYVARHWPRARHHFAAWLTPLAGIRSSSVWHQLVGHDVSAHKAGTASRTDWLLGACLLLPRTVFEALGGLDERFFMNSEETDLQRRADSLGIPAIYLPQIQVEHASGGSSDPTRRRGWLTDSWFRYANKWGGVRRLLVALRVATELNFVWNLQRQLRGKIDSASQVRSEEHALISHAWASRGGV